MKEYGKWNRWKSTVLTMAVLATGICGCSRNVDYQVETETTGKETSGGIVQFQNEDTWKDDCFKEKNIIRAAYSFEQTRDMKHSPLSDVACEA